MHDSSLRTDLKSDSGESSSNTLDNLAHDDLRFSRMPKSKNQRLRSFSITVRGRRREESATNLGVRSLPSSGVNHESNTKKSNEKTNEHKPLREKKVGMDGKRRIRMGKGERRTRTRVESNGDETHLVSSSGVHDSSSEESEDCEAHRLSEGEVGEESSGPAAGTERKAGGRESQIDAT